MTNRNLILAFALLAASCTTKKQYSYLEVLGVFSYTGGGPPPAGTTTPVPCTPASIELTSNPLNPVDKNGGFVAVNIQNNLSSNAAAASNRLNTNDFLVHQFVVDYEVLGAGAGIPEQIVPSSGLIAAGGTRKIGASLFPSGVTIPATAGTFIRTTFHAEGRLTDGSSVRTNDFEALFQICTTAGCAGSCGN